MVSIHVNAAGNVSKWLNATGCSVFACSGQTESDKLAECLCESAIKNFPGRRIRTDMSDGDMDWEEGFYILRKSWCPAVLTENFFMDNHSDLEYLQSHAGKQAIIDTHVEGIVEYFLYMPNCCLLTSQWKQNGELIPGRVFRSWDSETDGTNETVILS